MFPTSAINAVKMLAIVKSSNASVKFYTVTANVWLANHVFFHSQKMLMNVSGG